MNEGNREFTLMVVRQSMLVAAVIITVLILILLIPLPDGGRELQELLNLFHVPAFAVVTLLLSRATGCRTGFQKALLWVSLIVVGLLTEIAQSLVGRSPSWNDVVANCVGIFVGILAVQYATATSFGARIRLVLVGAFLFVSVTVTSLLVLVDSVLQRLETPMVASFEHRLELTRWTSQHCELRRTRSHATHGHWALRLDCRPAQYSGATLSWPLPDWSQYKELVFDISLDVGPPFDVIVKIVDAEHNHKYRDRFHRKLHVSPGTHQYRILLAEVADAPQNRQMDLQRIIRMQFFSVRLPTERTWFIDNVHLE